MIHIHLDLTHLINVKVDYLIHIHEDLINMHNMFEAKHLIHIHESLINMLMVFEVNNINSYSWGLDKYVPDIWSICMILFIFISTW